ncbi:MAG TPA: hypothetical protein DEG71_06275 [Clostridiales bacterium]|nr:hypothetical protein [Clostridiales bacterium]
MTDYQKAEFDHLQQHQNKAIVGKRRKDGKYPVSFVFAFRTIKNIIPAEKLEKSLEGFKVVYQR